MMLTLREHADKAKVLLEEAEELRLKLDGARNRRHMTVYDRDMMISQITHKLQAAQVHATLATL